EPLVTLWPALPATGLPILTPAGLPPAEHISLSWTHNRTGCFHSSSVASRRDGLTAPFPSAPLRTGLATFAASGSPVVHSEPARGGGARPSALTGRGEFVLTAR